MYFLYGLAGVELGEGGAFGGGASARGGAWGGAWPCGWKVKR